MARSDDKKDGKRGPSRPKTASTPKKETTARARKSASPPAEPRKKAAAAPPPRKAASAKAPAKPAARRGTAAAKPATAPSKTVAKGATTPPVKAGTRATRPAAAKKPAATRGKKAAPLAKAGAPGLDEEQRIEDAKYQPRDLPPRLFEEERFVFPESYGQSRIRLLVKDPEWLFAHWDVDPQSLADLRAELGERASALSKLTLRVSDPQYGGESRVLLPDGSRSWYVRADQTERSYQAQLGLTLPSGEFRSLAESNTVRTPRSGPAPGAAPRRARYDGATVEPATPAAVEPTRAAAAPAAPKDPGPWRPDPSTTSYPGPGTPPPDRGGAGRKTGRRGGTHGGASDAYRR